MVVRQEVCPSCAAPVYVPPNVSRMYCPYCSTSLSIERAGNEVALQLAEQVADAITGTGQKTQDAIHEGTYVTKAELRRLQMAQDMSTVQMRLANVQTEIRAIQRLPANSITKAQLKELRAQEAALNQQLATLQYTLNPGLRPPVQSTAAGKSTKYAPALASWKWLLFGFHGRTSQSGFWLGMLAQLPLLFVFSIFFAVIDQADGSDAAGCLALPAMIAMILGVWIALAVSVKRLHDRDKAGWWVLLVVIPMIGPLWLLIELGFLPGTSGRNQYE